jgi:hypothetical protein
MATRVDETKRFTKENVPGLPATLQLASQVAQELGRGALLLGTLPQAQAPGDEVPPPPCETA